MLDTVRQPDKRGGSTVPVGAVLAVAAVAGLGLAITRVARNRARHLQGNAIAPETRLRRSLTIMADVADLKDRWGQAETLARVLDPAIEIEPLGLDWARWRLALPVGQAIEWDMHRADTSDKVVTWRSTTDAGMPSVVEAKFRPATGGRGTVMTLRLDFAPPLGRAGDLAVRLFAKPIRVAALGALYRFRALVETGEIPTLKPLPAARGDGADR